MTDDPTGYDSEPPTPDSVERRYPRGGAEDGHGASGGAVIRVDFGQRDAPPASCVQRVKLSDGEITLRWARPPQGVSLGDGLPQPLTPELAELIRREFGLNLRVEPHDSQQPKSPDEGVQLALFEEPELWLEPVRGKATSRRRVRQHAEGSTPAEQQLNRTAREGKDKHGRLAVAYRCCDCGAYDPQAGGYWPFLSGAWRCRDHLGQAMAGTS